VRRVGFYNSFVVRAPSEPMPELSLSLDAGGTRVQAIRGSGLASFQFHPESVLTTEGPQILAAELARLHSAAPEVRRA
jgi:phenazine biosynthesis protein phzE